MSRTIKAAGTGLIAWLVLLGTASGIARAGQLDPGAFDYVGTVSMASASSAAPAPTTTSATLDQGGAVVSLAAFSGSGFDGIGSGTDVVFGQISVGRSTIGTTNLDINYDYRLTLTDLSGPAPASDYVDILGVLTGSVTKTDSGAMRYNVANTFLTDRSTLMLNGETFSVIPDGFSAPSNIDGAFGTHFTVVPEAGIVSISSATPEPSTLVMAAIGAAAILTLAARRNLHRRHD